MTEVFTDFQKAFKNDAARSMGGLNDYGKKVLLVVQKNF